MTLALPWNSFIMLQYRIFFKSLHIFAILARNWQIVRAIGPAPARAEGVPAPEGRSSTFFP